MNYSVTHRAKNKKYIITVSVSIPVLRITDILNLRIRKCTLLNGETVMDPFFKDSVHCFEITNEILGKNKTFEFSFDPNEISNVNYFIIGFCDEHIRWYENTFVTVKANQALLNNLLKDSFDKICMLSTWDIKCGIAQYCKNLYNSLIARKSEVKVFPHTEEYDNITNFIIENNYNVFVVQYEPAIIKDFAKLSEHISFLRTQNKKIKVFFIIHSENPDLLLLDGKIDGLIYHKKNTLLFRQTRIHILPMGVPTFEPVNDVITYRKKYDISDKSFVISTVGFMFGWKQHANVLSALVPLLKRNKFIVIQLLTSFHSINNGECIEEYNKIRDVITTNDIESQVIHVTDYIPQDELSERLYLSNIGFLWAGIETTSSSASLKEFVAARLPVVRTNSTHYHDIKSGCEITQQSIELFVKTIETLMSSKLRLKALKSEMTDNYNLMNYTKVASKFSDIFNAS